MDMRALLGAAWKRKWLVALGFLVGAVLSFNSLYRADLEFVDGRPRVAISENSHASYEANVQLMLFDPAFGIGRAGQDRERPDSFNRTVQLAPSYAALLTSQPVMRALEASNGPVDVAIAPTPVENSPIIQVKVSGSDGARVVQIADGVAPAFMHYLKDSQESHEIPAYDRMIVRQLSAAGRPMVTISRNTEIAALAFLMPIAMVFALVFILENVTRPQVDEKEEDAALTDEHRVPSRATDDPIPSPIEASS